MRPKTPRRYAGLNRILYMFSVKSGHLNRKLGPQLPGGLSVAMESCLRRVLPDGALQGQPSGRGARFSFFVRLRFALRASNVQLRSQARSADIHVGCPVAHQSCGCGFASKRTSYASGRQGLLFYRLLWHLSFGCGLWPLGEHSTLRGRCFSKGPSRQCSCLALSFGHRLVCRPSYLPFGCLQASCLSLPPAAWK